MKKGTTMEITGYLVRNKGVVWRDIAGQVVIAERDSGTVHVLNETASLIWILADGTKLAQDMAAEVCSRFEVTPENALADTNEFCQQLLEAILLSSKNDLRRA